jgi:hypothetical protein
MAQPISVSLTTLPPASLAANTSQNVAATVVGDSTHAGVVWTVTCNTAGNCGSFSSAVSLSTTYTAPSAVPRGSAVTLTVTAVADKTKSASAAIIVTGAVSTTLAPGNYVFSLSGTNASGFYFVAGVFSVASGGIIAGGEQDLAEHGNVLSDAITGGTIAARSDGDILITLNTADASVGIQGTETLEVALISTTSALLSEFDASASSSGTLDMQATGLSTPSGGYAFSTIGLDRSGSPLALGGIINVDGSGVISGTGSVFDMNDHGVLSPDQSFAASTVTAPDSLGRVSFLLNPDPASSVPPFTLAGYMVDASHLRLVEASDSLGGSTGGTALGQALVGTFSSIDILGANLVLVMAGSDGAGAVQVVGLLETSSNAMGGYLSFNDLAAQSPQGGVYAVGRYTVDSTGRVTLTGVTDSNADFTYNLQIYLTGDGKHALVISMDIGDVLAGQCINQSVGAVSLSAALFSGNYALNVAEVTPISGFASRHDGVGTVTADGVGSLTGFLDLNEGGVLATDRLTSGTFALPAISNGNFIGTMTGVNQSSSNTPYAFTYYYVDSTQVVGIETDANQLTLAYFELQQ